MMDFKSESVEGGRKQWTMEPFKTVQQKHDWNEPESPLENRPEVHRGAARRYWWIPVLVGFAVYGGWWLTPQSYAECLQAHIKNAHTNRAVYLMEKSCAMQFPEK